ncbi:hypothetical protein QE405_002746 [Nocardioides zeae]|uniref:Uncharacterized protein n=1 Tax=Nocardioides zeae TaxID=1457234 RepID=A0AAJ1U8J5_9ACTN|nr:hypothetical protein [Nocardioides zeae]MDQ1105462.1 hypothetical protein [Nocardioides zeae]
MMTIEPTTATPMPLSPARSPGIMNPQSTTAAKPRPTSARMPRTRAMTATTTTKRIVMASRGASRWGWEKP